MSAQHPNMKTSLLASVAIAIASIAPVSAAIVSQTFTGVTTSQPAELNSEFPAGTKWTLVLKWDDTAAPLSTTPTQTSWRVTKMTLTLQGKSGAWTTSAVANSPSFTLNEFAGTDSIQFTSGWGPAAHTNPTIGSLQPYSINLVLEDPTGSALAGVTPVPSMIDLSKWDPAQSHLKFYLSNDASKTIFGSIDLASAAKDPDIAVGQVGGKNLKDGKSKVSFGKSKTGSKGATRKFKIRNTGKAALKKLKLKLTGTARKDYKVGKLRKTTLKPGASTTVTVTFKPRKPGKRNALLKITSNDPDESPFDIKLKGKGVAP